MNQIIEKDVTIENMIYEIRGKQVMLDSDLAKLYQCANGTKTINLAVNRNIDRFPNDFYFQLTWEEYNNLKFQIETSNSKHGGVRKLPYVFTEQGVAMLATVIHTSVASKVSINIMRSFALMRKYISTNLVEQKYYSDMLMKHDSEIRLLQESFNKLEDKRKINEIYFEGQIYDAYSKIIDIFKSCNKQLIIIDAYADKTILDIIRNLNIDVILITSFKSRLNKTDIYKYNKQYNNLNIVYDNSFHDRYFILDEKIVYHCGTSLNYIGKKTFSINKIEDELVIKCLMNKINECEISKNIE